MHELLVVDGLGGGVQGGVTELRHLLLGEGLALLHEDGGDDLMIMIAMMIMVMVVVMMMMIVMLMKTMLIK